MKNNTDNKLHAPTPLDCPACSACGQPTRFVGLETLSGNNTADLCTYECTACGRSEVDLVPRAHSGFANGAATTLAS
jgi:hypothetical protein